MKDYSEIIETLIQLRNEYKTVLYLNSKHALSDQEARSFSENHTTILKTNHMIEKYTDGDSSSDGDVHLEQDKY